MDVKLTKDFTIDHPAKALALIEQINGGLSYRLSWDGVRNIVHKLLVNHPWIFYGLTNTSNVKLYRGRIDNSIKKFDSTQDLSYKPKEIVNDYGRCNKPNESIFYGSTNIETVLSEITPEIGDRIHFSTSSIKKENEIIVTSIGEIDHIRRYGASLTYNQAGIYQHINNLLSDLKQKNPDIHLMALLIDAFLSEIFSKPAYTYKDYKFTSAVSDIIYSYHNTDEENRNDGFSYPSVKHRGGINYSIKADSFDKYMKIEKAFIIEITDSLGFGLYGYKMINESENIINQKIKWKS